MSTVNELRLAASTSAVVLNDMINANLRTGVASRDDAIEASGLVRETSACVAEARLMDIPIIWISVGRRSDRKDVRETLTDTYIAGGSVPKPPITRGSYEAQNVAELPIAESDHTILKPRFSPFVGTDLELRLRFLEIRTLLLGGYSTNIGVESCARTARDLGFDVVILSDCCFNVDQERHRWALANSLPNFARVMTWRQAFALL